LSEIAVRQQPKSRQGLDWLLAQHPYSRLHLREWGIHWSSPPVPPGWVKQRGWPSYELILTRYEPEQWDRFVISRSGRVYPMSLEGVVEHDPIWKP